MRLLLDTCSLLWIASDAPEVSPIARALFADADNEVLLSAVSAWEIAVKHALGKLRLPDPPARFVPSMREQHLILPLPLDEQAVLRLASLPSHHRDPFDRMLVCQALADGLTLLTPDPLIQQYPVSTIW